VMVYTRAGGSYVVCRENFGYKTAQIAAVALKIDDGAARAAELAVVIGLRQLGVSGEALDELGTEPVLGGGRPVGLIRPADSAGDRLIRPVTG
ncbi:MAG: hypothetical protein QOI26_1979, partial [Pseudonocardiales bacterium]|nr:hypothetical protein [Pseudonocardiales bacterium]